MPDAFTFPHDSHGQPRTEPADVAIAGLAKRQFGIVSRAQLLALGLGRGAIEHRVRRKRLHPVFRGVYSLVPGKLGREALWMAAVLAAGPAAALSHWSGAALWAMRSGSGPIPHVTSPLRRQSRPGLKVHCAQLPGDEVTVEQGIPVTVPARVVLDLAPHARPAVLQRMLEKIERLRLYRGSSVAELVDRYPRRAGTPKLKDLINRPLPFTRSDLEAHFLSLIDSWGLPRPDINTNIAGHEVDTAWRDKRIIVELDTFETHGSSFAFERDRRRDRALQAAGWTVIRVTGEQLEERALRADLAALLR